MPVSVLHRCKIVRSAWANPGRGIAAGCSWAAYLVQMYVLAPLGIWTQAQSHIRFAMFIDELLLQCHGRSFSLIVSQLYIAA
eukprot:9160363-Pyramimonas_sp.AAC.1